LSESIAAMRALSEALPKQEFAGQVLAHQIAGLEKLVAAFNAAALETQPRLEANQGLVSRMLDNYRESYAFMLQVTEEVQTSYNAQGVQQTKGRNSGFTVKA
jgi:hypothetical protein